MDTMGRSRSIPGSDTLRKPRYVATSLLAAAALAVGASPMSASATGLGGARTAQCPPGKTVQLHWQNTGEVDLFGTPGRHLNLNDYIGTYPAGRNSFNTGREVFSWIFGFAKPGEIVEGTNDYDCVNLKA
jgi:hypothetical protein